MPNMVVVSGEVPEDRADAGASWQRDSDHVFTKFSVSRLIGSGPLGTTPLARETDPVIYPGSDSGALPPDIMDVVPAEPEEGEEGAMEVEDEEAPGKEKGEEEEREEQSKTPSEGNEGSGGSSEDSGSSSSSDDYGKEEEGEEEDKNESMPQENGLSKRKRKSQEKRKEEKKKRQKKREGEDDVSSDEEEVGGEDETKEGEKEAKAPSRKRSKRGLDDKKRKKKKGRHLRRNIKDVLEDKDLEDTTKQAQAEEVERLRRLQEQKRQRLQAAFLAQIEERQMNMLHEVEKKFDRQMVAQTGGYMFSDPGSSLLNSRVLSVPRAPFLQCRVPSLDEKRPQEVVQLSSSSEGEDATKSKRQALGGDDSDVKILSGDEALGLSDDDDQGEDDPNNSGDHINDVLNVPDPETGRVLVNPGHPREDEDIFLAPQIARAIKPHQIGGIRFLYDNIIESNSQFSSSSGFGCILAHSMGLGKTIQLVAFSDIFLRHTPAKHVLCIVPVNTVQNWIAEFGMWVPEDKKAKGETKEDERAQEEKGEVKKEEEEPVRPRNFGVHVLNDALKNLDARGKVILRWQREGGVLLMGYELYRLLASKKKPRKKKPKGPECIDLEVEDKNKSLLDEIHLALVDPGPDLVICDEGHRIKNSHASISQALKSIRTKRRIVLTGYPLQNNLMEYWCMVDFVRPSFLGTKTEFANMFERPILNGQCTDSTPRDVRLMMHRAHVLHQQLRGFVQRRGHKVLQLSLPPKYEHVLMLRMTPVQRRLYRAFMEELLSAKRSVSNPLKAFAVCCKIWNHPDVLLNFLRKKEAAEDLDLDMEELSSSAGGSKKGAGKGRAAKKDSKGSSGAKAAPSISSSNGFDGGPLYTQAGPGFNPFAAEIEAAVAGKKDEISYDWAQDLMTDYVAGRLENSAKFEVFFSILEETVRCGDRLLLFSQSLLTLDLLEDYLQARQIPDGSDRPWLNGTTYFRLDGSTPGTERERLINAFNASPDVPLFIVSTRAGSLGVNLVGANRVVVLDASWNPCHDSQAVCRVYRYGQRKPTHIYRLVTDNSLEKKIYDRQVNKQGMSDRVVDEQNPDSHFTSKDIHKLICDGEEDPEPPEEEELARFYSAVKEEGDTVKEEEGVIDRVVRRCRHQLTRAPFTHESLLVDRKEKRLSRAEKRLAERSYQMEKGSRVSYSRPSYAAFYPKPGFTASNLNNPGSTGYSRQRYFDTPSLGVPSTSSAPMPTTSYSGYPHLSPPSLSTPSTSSSYLPYPPPPSLSSAASSSSSQVPSTSLFLQQHQQRPVASVRPMTTASTTVSGGQGTSASCSSSSGPPSSITNAEQARQMLMRHRENLQQHQKFPDPGCSSSGPPPMAPFPYENGHPFHNPPAPQRHHQHHRGGGGHSSASSTSSTASFPSLTSSSGKRFPVEALARQGVAIQELQVPRDMVIPTNSPDQPPIGLKQGQRVMVIRTPKGIYLRMEEKIIKIKLPQGLLGATVPQKTVDKEPTEVVTLSDSSEDGEQQQPQQEQELNQREPRTSERNQLTAAKDLFELVASATTNSPSNSDESTPTAASSPGSASPPSEVGGEGTNNGATDKEVDTPAVVGQQAT